jgi:nucleoside-diphosphate-sugar epimerase
MTTSAAIRDNDELEDLLSRPDEGVIETMGRLEGDILVLGVGGKMGPTLARMARRASDAAGIKRHVIGVSRFSSVGLAERLHAEGIETISADLLEREAFDRLPETENVVYMAGMKFGSTGKEAMTWAMNTYLAGMVAEKYRNSRIVAFSTGNVYGMAPLAYGGSQETDALNPLGDYAQSCLGRERMFEHFSRTFGTKTALIRLNYAVEMRYGVLVDIGRRVAAGEVVDLTVGAANVIWQGDANAMSLKAFDHVSSPPFLLNVSGPEQLSVRRVAEEFGRLFGCAPQFAGEEGDMAFLSNGQLGHRLFGYPRVSTQQMILWIADWIRSGGSSLGKPTHFEASDGKY